MYIIDEIVIYKNRKVCSGT